jgi:hypothetical protein
MIFLIEYDRVRGKIVEMQSFNVSERSEAEKLRLGKELTLNRRGVTREVVLLEAADEHALQLTHRRYFENVLELADCKIASLSFP